MNSRKTFLKVLDLGPSNSRTRFSKLGFLHILVSFADLLSIAFLVSLMAAAIKYDRATSLQHYLASEWSVTIAHHSLLLLMACASLLSFGLKNYFAFSVAKKSLMFAQDFSAYLSEKLVNAFYQRGFSFLRNEKIFKITHRTASLPFEFASVTLKSVFALLAQMAMCLAFLIFSLALDPVIALILLAGAFPAIGLMFMKHRKKSQQFGKEKNEKLPSNNRALHKLYESFVELKIYGAKDLFVQQFLHHLNGFNAIRFRQQLLTIYPRRVLETVAIALIISLFSYRILMEGSPDAFIVDILVLGVFGYKVIPALANIMDAMVVLNATKDTQTNLIENLKNDASPKKALSVIETFETLEFSGISYRFGSTEILNQLDFQLGKGEITGVVGRSGEGKSTFLRIAMGLLEPYSGKTLVNGNSEELYNNDSWFRHLGFIDADSSMLDASIYENVSLGALINSDTQMRVEKALYMVGLQEFVGKDRSVGEDGKALSSGQRQRLALARALFHQPSILVLDEFTSHLDEETEGNILAMIEELNKSHQLTILIVSHRRSTMGIASNVFELKKKRLVKIK